MKDSIIANPLLKLSRMAIMAFVLSLMICSCMVGAVIMGRMRTEAVETEQFIFEKSLRIEDTLSKLFYKTEVLAALVRHGGGSINDFDGIAALIVDDPAILNVLIAPGGIVSNAYSVSGDVSALIGHDFFADSDGNLEAIKAVETGEFVMAGPFVPRQGGVVLAGRLPVFLDAEREDFWGLVSVTLRFPEALDNVELGKLRMQGYEYELWRIDPDTNLRQVLDSNVVYANVDGRFVERPVYFFNAEWYLRLFATRSWYSYPDVLILIVAGLFISFLVLFIAQNNFRLNQARAELAVLAKADPLTGIYNRRHFAELMSLDLERARRFNETAHVILFDVDFFKEVNDKHGHLVGDEVLIEIAQRMKTAIRPYDLFARYGGEEFIIYTPNTSREGAMATAERLRQSICEHPFKLPEVKLNISASFGVARVDESGIEKTLRLADTALYRAKEAGRNNVVFYE